MMKIKDEFGENCTQNIKTGEIILNILLGLITFPTFLLLTSGEIQRGLTGTEKEWGPFDWIDST